MHNTSTNFVRSMVVNRTDLDEDFCEFRGQFSTILPIFVLQALVTNDSKTKSTHNFAILLFKQFFASGFVALALILPCEKDWRTRC